MPEADKMELVYSLVGFPNETEWIEFKEGNNDPEQIGEDISALANSAAYHERDYAYKIWGVTDDVHDLVGTAFDPYAQKKGNQSLLVWLSKALSLNAQYSFDVFEDGGKRYVTLVVRSAQAQPVTFRNVAYIREGSSTTRLVGGSAKEATLWRKLQGGSFEMQLAERDLPPDGVFELLDAASYFSLLGVRQPSGQEGVLASLAEQDMVRRQDNGHFAITNLGALAVAKRLTAFRGLQKRPLRVVRFAGKGNFDIMNDETFDQGYALALPEAEKHIMSQIPETETADGAFRRISYAYPQRAVRELLSNMVIHQDLTDTTAGPLVMLYSDRIVFSNPGTTLIPVRRVLNAQPKSRNARLVSVMRQMDLCEEGGTGWDLIIASCEAMHIAAPEMKSEEGLGTTVTMYSGGAFERMTKAERREGAYWHACLMYAQGDAMSNKSLRERFGLPSSQKNIVAISRLLRECRETGLIKEEDEEVGDKYRRYVPYWA